jgi:acetolactate synthase I/II/III large subunit
MPNRPIEEIAAMPQKTAARVRTFEATVPKTEPTAKTGAETVVRALEARGTEYVFGIPGAKIDAVFDALVDSKIQTVVCRHEQNAAFIAGGIGRMTGKAGVAIATSGPGVSNLVTGLATANSEGDPVVALGGAVATSEALKQIHQTMDSVSIMKPVTKFSATVQSPFPSRRRNCSEPP